MIEIRSDCAGNREFIATFNYVFVKWYEENFEKFAKTIKENRNAHFVKAGFVKRNQDEE